MIAGGRLQVPPTGAARSAVITPVCEDWRHLVAPSEWHAGPLHLSRSNLNGPNRG